MVRPRRDLRFGHEGAIGRIDPPIQQHQANGKRHEQQHGTEQGSGEPAHRSAIATADTTYGSIFRTVFMMTGSRGTSSKPRLRPVSTAAILSTTSIPSVTRANTA